MSVVVGVGVAVLSLVVASGCSDDSDSKSSSSSDGSVGPSSIVTSTDSTNLSSTPTSSLAVGTAPVDDLTGPVGIVALGHSGLTGENSVPERAGQPALENSWATGTADGLGSIYQRMVELRPETAGHVANEARGGTPAADLTAQARRALKEVPTPELVIIQTIDHDIRCDGTDDAHVAEFGAALETMLTVVTEASPDTKILMLTQPGRPALELESMAELIASTPAARASYTGPPPCGMLNESGDQQPENIATLTSIIESYETEQARVCAEYLNCSTDSGRLASFRRVPSMVSSDFNHLNTEGLARLAAAVWPIVENIISEH